MRISFVIVLSCCFVSIEILYVRIDIVSATNLHYILNSYCWKELHLHPGSILMRVFEVLTVVLLNIPYYAVFICI
jgi:hypothetical protein